MKYYIIKITSAYSNPTISEKVKTAFIESGLSASNMEPHEENDDGLMKNRKKYLRYTPTRGFSLTSKVTANIFSEESLKDEFVMEFLKDKSYELEETDDKCRLLRYRKE